MTIMTLPSGKFLPEMYLPIVRQMADVGTIRWSDTPFTLKSGVQSNVYVFGREDLTDNPSLLQSLGTMAAHKAQDRLRYPQKGGNRTGFIGIPTAGTALAVAAGMNPSCFSRIMREWRKETYGVHKAWVNGAYTSKCNFVTIDNVITDGATKLEALKRLQEDGYPVRGMLHLVLVDRQQGGIEKLQEQGFMFASLFNLLDLVYAFGELELWPKERIKAVEDEIAAHQFT